VAQPFLGESEHWVAEHQREVGEAVTAYLAKVAGEPIPDREEEQLPEPLLWLWRLEMYKEVFGTSLPWPGGILDQPYLFLMELEAAHLARKEFISAREANAEAQSAEASDHPPIPIGGKGFLGQFGG